MDKGRRYILAKNGVLELPDHSIKVINITKDTVCLEVITKDKRIRGIRFGSFIIDDTLPENP